jgi:transcriptional regulator with XRE-family HTH domain
MRSNTNYRNKLNAIGGKIRDYRKKKKITQPQICREFQLLGIDMTINSLKKIESGDRVIKEYELAGFSQIFNVSADELLKDCIENLSK